MSNTKFLLPIAILIFAVGGLSIAQNKPKAPRAAAVAAPTAAPQTPAPAQATAVAAPAPPQTPAPPAPPQEPRAWSFAFGGGDNYLGISPEPITSENQNTYGAREVRGVGVRSVVEGGPAEKAGLRKNDVILRFDNEPVTSVRKLNRLVDEAEPDHTAQLTISRGGAEQQVTVKLGHRENQVSRVFRTGPGGTYRLDRNMPGFNMAFGGGRQIGVGTSPLTKQLGEYFGVPEGGVLVSNVNDNSPAARAGIKAGDVIVEADGKKIDSSMDLVRAIGEKNEGDVTLTIVRNRNRQTVRVTPEKREWKPGALGDLNFPQLSELEGLSDLELPEIDIPEFTVPEIDVPEIDVPEINIPDIDLTPLQQIENIQIPKVIVSPKIQKIRVAPIRIAPIRIAPVRIPPVKIDPITIL